MTNQYPYRYNTTQGTASEDDPRYETPGGAANKIEQALEDAKEYTDAELITYVAQTVNLADDSVTRPKIAPGAVGATELDPSLLDYTTDIAVAAKFNEVDAQLADIAINVKTMGAVGDGVTDDTAALQAAFNLGGNIYIPIGIYNHTGLSINTPVNISSPAGNIAILDNKGTTHSITVNAACTIDGVMIRGNASSGSGLYLNKQGKFSKLILDLNGRYGVEFRSDDHIVAAFFTECTISANKLGGVYSVSSATSQKNVVSFLDCYVVANGNTSGSVATPTSGHGYYIEGGIAWSITGGVSEVNAGAGIYLKSRSDYFIYGLNIKGVHLETNRYANLLIDATNGQMQDVIADGNYYINAATWPGSLIPTEGSRSIVRNWRRLFRSSIDKTYDLGILTSNVLKSKTSLKFGGDFEHVSDFTPYTSQIVSDNAQAEGYNVIQVTAASGGYTEVPEFSTFIDPHFSYRLVMEYRYKKSSSSSATISFLQLDKDKINIGSPISLGLGATDAWTTRDRVYVSTTFLANTRYLQVSVSMAGTADANDYVLVRRLSVYKVDGVTLPSGTTAQRPTVEGIGFQWFDTSLNKIICWNGTAWKDAMGTTV